MRGTKREMEGRKGIEGNIYNVSAVSLNEIIMVNTFAYSPLSHGK